MAKGGVLQMFEGIFTKLSIVPIDVVIYLAYGIIGAIVVAAVRSSKKKKKLHSIHLIGGCFLFIGILGRWGFPIYIIVVAGVFVSIMCAKILILVDFCDSCSKMVKGRKRSDSYGLLCYKCEAKWNRGDVDKRGNELEETEPEQGGRSFKTRLMMPEKAPGNGLHVTY